MRQRLFFGYRIAETSFLLFLAMPDVSLSSHAHETCAVWNYPLSVFINIFILYSQKHKKIKLLFMSQ